MKLPKNAKYSISLFLLLLISQPVLGLLGYGLFGYGRAVFYLLMVWLIAIVMLAQLSKRHE